MYKHQRPPVAQEEKIHVYHKRNSLAAFHLTGLRFLQTGGKTTRWQKAYDSPKAQMLASIV